MWWKRPARDRRGATVSLREGLKTALGHRINNTKGLLARPLYGSDVDPMIDAILDYLEAKVAVPMFLTSKLTGAWAVCDPDDADALVVDINALRIQENQL
jgi:hypothetical protein